MSYHATHPMQAFRNRLLNPQDRHNPLLNRYDEWTTDTLSSMLPHAKWLQGDHFCHPSTPNLHPNHRLTLATSLQRDDINVQIRDDIVQHSNHRQHSDKGKGQRSTRSDTSNTPLLQKGRKEPRIRIKVPEETQITKAQIDKPKEYDVVFERGGFSVNHPGNISYRNVLEDIRPSYKSTSSRKVKKALVVSVMNHISKKQNGKFLTRDRSGVWVQLSDSCVRLKISQALRDDRS